MPEVKQRIEELMKMEKNPLVYLEYTPQLKSTNKFFQLKNLFSQRSKSNLRICMGYVSRPFEDTYRITTCRHLVTNQKGEVSSKEEILEGLEVFARYEGVNKKFHKLMFEDVDIKIHIDILADLLFIEITRPDNYNFQLLNQASIRCRRRYPGNLVYYFQHQNKEKYFRLFEGKISREKIYITGISIDGHFFFQRDRPQKHHRAFHTIDTTKELLIKGASGSPILSRRGEVVGIMCAHDQAAGKGIYLSIEKIERLYEEINDYHL